LADALDLGPLEWVHNTSRHHQVHYASNAACVDKNFGAVLIVHLLICPTGNIRCIFPDVASLAWP
jgi:hypothetical protein